MDISKAEIAGPCSITFNGVNIGHTLDGVEFTAERHFSDVNVDKYGDTPIDKVLTGQNVMLKFKLAQPNYAQLVIAMPEDANYDGAGALDRVALGGDAGYSLRQNSALLTLHPLKNIPTDLSADVTIYKAVSTENVTLPFKVKDQKVIEITMTALVDEEFGVGRRLGHIGYGNVS